MTDQIERVAAERSSVAQDELGLTPEQREAWELGWLDAQRHLTALRVRIEEVDRKAVKETDGDDWITGYTLPVGPWHRLLAEARK